MRIAQNTDETYMRRCIELARHGVCGAAPNPMVGAVIVCDGRIIGEGYHIRCGEAHAEVNAIRSVSDPSLLCRSTIYVSLEPCAHYGKTPPCADLIVEKQIPRIVIGCRDPFSKVAGRGIRKLLDAGREVKVGVLEEECRELIRRFLTFHTLHRPFVTLKWAESADGFLDVHREGGTPARLSSPLTTLLVHKRRAEHAAILVGRRTALLDNPSLSVRCWSGPQPLRLVLDRTLSLPEELHLFDGTQPTCCFTACEGATRPHTTCLTLDYRRDILPQLLERLHEAQIQSVLVEGGAQLHQAFIDDGLWDEAVVEQSPVLLGDGVKAPCLKDIKSAVSEQHFGHSYRLYESRNGL